MDSQEVSRSSNDVLAYTTDCYAEFYDLWVESPVVGQHSPDEETYWSAIQSVIKFRETHPTIHKSSPINVVELGSGSGRCLKDLFERAHATGTSFPNVHLYAIDPSAPMLKRTMAWFDKRPALKEMALIEWVEGVGEDFTDKLPQLKGACDLVMFTGGGFSHMCSEEQQLAFLRQLRAALRDGDSAATGIILMYNQSIPLRKTAWGDRMLEIPWEGRGEVDASIGYWKIRNEVSWEGPVRRDRWEIAMLKGEVEVHREKVDHTMMDLDEGRWPILVEEAGLKVEKEEAMEELELFFYLKRIE